MGNTHVRCALIRILRALVLAWLISAVTAAASGQPIVYVDDDAAPGGNGSSWGTAYNSLQAALDAAGVPGSGITDIRVGQGLYKPTHRTEPSLPRSATFRLFIGTALRGGYAGIGSKDPDDWNPAEFESILSGDLDGDDQPGFVNNSENACHVVLATGLDGSGDLDGFIIAGGNADTDWASYGAGLFCTDYNDLSVKNCTFVFNYSDLGGAGGLGCAFFGEVQILDCHFDNNSTTGVGGGIDLSQGSSALVKNCVFSFNHADVVGGGIRFASNCQVVGCLFKGNSTGLIGGGAYAGATSGIIKECSFVNNSSDWLGGGAGVGNPTLFTNCVFSRNHADGGGAVFVASATTVINCSLSGNTGGGIGIFTLRGTASLLNSILWGNVPYQIGEENGPPSDAVSAGAGNCDIQGGWPGSNNISLDPMFIQPGCDNLRLADESPCIDMGNNASIPPGTTTDLDGQARIQNSIVDMGAYEGGHDPLPPTACEDNLDQGWTVKLMPTGSAFNPPTTSAIYIENVSAPDNAWVTVTQIDSPQHPGAGGFNELGSILDVQTSLPDSQFFMRVYIPFTPANLNGFDPLDADLTCFDAQSGDWQLAALANTQNSPGHKGPIGDRIVTVGSSWNNIWTFELGDYGVFWNPSTQQGFVWANVDHASDFAFGIKLPQCSGDCAYPTNGIVNQDDLTTVINSWGLTPSGPASFADINHDGLVNAADLLAVLNGWGPCP